MAAFLFICIVSEWMFISVVTIRLCVKKCRLTSRISYVIEALCFSGIYTMLVFMVSVYATARYESEFFPLPVLGTQTVLFLILTPFFWKFIRKRLRYILQSKPFKMRKYITYGGFWWLSTILSVVFAFVKEDCYILKIVSLLLLGTMVMISYSMVYEFSVNKQSAEKMEQIATTDHLTKLPNRYSLWEDAQKLIGKRIPFAILYMDLNDFKKVNDVYGHLVGDKYLSIFAEHLSCDLGEVGTAYRISGDEFLFLFWGSSPREVIDLVQKIDFTDIETGPFLGVSLGLASYPSDGSTFDDILAAADLRMYEDKRRRKERIRITPSF